MPRKAPRPTPPSVPIETFSRFTSSIVHKVTDPLSVIIGHAQLLLLQFEQQPPDARKADEELISTVEMILKEGKRLASLMDKLLGLLSKLSGDGPSTADALDEIERFAEEAPAAGPDSPPLE
jgi:signal transduction histidine kinase